MVAVAGSRQRCARFRSGAHLWVPISCRVVVGQRCHLDSAIALTELYRTGYQRHTVDGRRDVNRYRKSDLRKSVRNSQIHATYCTVRVEHAIQTLPACPDAPHLMRHVLTALRSSLAHRVSRSIHNRPGPNEFSRRAAAGRCSSALSMRRSSRSQLEPRGEAWRAARVRPLAALRAAACADGRHGARLVLHAGRYVRLPATSGRLQSHT